MRSDRARAIERQLRQRAMQAMNPTRFGDYVTHMRRPRMQLLRPEWALPVLVLALIPMLQPSSDLCHVLMMVYATGIAFWLAGQLRAKVYGRDMGLLAYFPVSDADYFRHQFRLTLEKATPLLLALALLTPDAQGMLVDALTWVAGRPPFPPQAAYHPLAALLWPALHFSCALSLALLLYRLLPSVDGRRVAALAWLYALGLAASQSYVIWSFSDMPALALLPAGWVESLRLALEGADSQFYLPVLPLAALWLAAPACLASAARSFHVRELILSTPGDPTPSIPTGAGSNESPAEVLDMSPAAQARRQARKRLLEPTALQLLRAEHDAGHRLWQSGGVERIVGMVLSPAEKSIVRFMAADGIDWTLRYRQAILAVLAAFLAFSLTALPTIAAQVVPALSDGLGAKFRPLLATDLLVYLALFGSLASVGCLVYSAMRAAPFLGGSWPGLLPVQAGTGASPPMYAGLPVDMTDALVAMVKVNVMRTLLWLPLPALFLSTVGVLLGGPWWVWREGMQWLQLLSCLFLMGLGANPLLLTVRFLPLSSTSRSVTYIAAMTAFAVAALLYFGFQCLAVGILVAHPAKTAIAGMAVSVGVSAVACAVAWATYRLGRPDLLHVPPEGGMIVEG